MSDVRHVHVSEPTWYLLSDVSSDRGMSEVRHVHVSEPTWYLSDVSSDRGTQKHTLTQHQSILNETNF
jgi:hypothetical protein